MKKLFVLTAFAVSMVSAQFAAAAVNQTDPNFNGVQKAAMRSGESCKFGKDGAWTQAPRIRSHAAVAESSGVSVRSSGRRSVQ